MSEPKFRVGEEVVVQSRHVPEFEAVVTNIIGDFPSIVICEFTKEFLPSTYGYYLQPCPFNDGIGWHEDALRKKHKPGDSFESIMNECKTGEAA